MNENETSNTGAQMLQSSTDASKKETDSSPQPRSGFIWIWILAAAIIVVALGIILWVQTLKVEEGVPQNEEIVRIGLSLDSVKIQRWADERDIMEAKAKELGATVTVFSADNDDDTQIAQIENLISQKVDVIIVIPHDSELVGPVITKAQEAGIKVIAYDRLTDKSIPDLYLSFDSVKVGNNAARFVIDAIDSSIPVPSIAFVGGSPADRNGHFVHDGAMQVLEPLAAEGKIELVYNEYTPDWNPSIAYTKIKQLLDSGAHVDGIAVGNDGMAYGVVQALAEYGLDGKVPVSGQDGELEAIKRIVAGTQTMTSWKPGKPLAELAIKAAIALARGEEPETNSVIANDTGEVESYLFDPVPVTKENIDDTIIKNGVFTKEQVYGAATAL